MKNELLSVLTNSSLARLCILGVGSEFKADDGAGVLLVKHLEEKLNKYKFTKEQLSRLMLLDGSTAPENFTGNIKSFQPSHLVIVDAAEMGLKPGEIKLIDEKDIAGVSFSTHVLPIAVMINYLKQSIDFKTVVIGIEPKDLEFGQSISKEVKTAVKKLTGELLESIKETLKI